MKVMIGKLIVFAALMSGFYALDGFERPTVRQDSLRSTPKMVRAWVMTVALFVGGAVTMLWGRQVGDALSQDLPHGSYFIIGLMITIAGLVWMLMVRDAARM